MALEPKESDLDMYADDSTLGTVGDTIEILNNKLCADMVQIGEWCTDNKMVSNTDTIKAIIITSYQQYNHLNIKELSILLGEDFIQNVKVEKLLGVKVDQNLSWRAHIDKVYSTVSMILARFRQVKPLLPTYARIRFEQVFSFPHFYYCNYVWGCANLESFLNFKNGQ